MKNGAVPFVSRSQWLILSAEIEIGHIRHSSLRAWTFLIAAESKQTDRIVVERVLPEAKFCLYFLASKRENKDEEWVAANDSMVLSR